MTVTLRSLITDYPALFRQDQSWYDGEAFLTRRVVGTLAPDFRVSDVVRPEEFVPAVLLAQLYITMPADFRWRRWLWTADKDRDGQRVYLGVIDGRMEIHRHLHLTYRWGCPTW